MSDERPGLPTRLWRACLLILGSAFCLWLAVRIVSEIWIVLLVGLLAIGLVAGLILWLRVGHDRW
jgi:hypothetical protein